MASLRRRLSCAVLLLPLLFLLASPLSDVSLIKLESQSSINGLTVSLQCLVRFGVLGNRSYFRELNGQVEKVIPEDGSESTPLLTFVLTPNLEGVYFCRVGNTTSNRLELVGRLLLIACSIFTCSTIVTWVLCMSWRVCPMPFLFSSIKDVALDVPRYCMYVRTKMLVCKSAICNVMANCSLSKVLSIYSCSTGSDSVTVIVKKQ